MSKIQLPTGAEARNIIGTLKTFDEQNPDLQTSSNFPQTLHPGTVANTQTSRTSHTSRESGENARVYGLEDLKNVPVHDVEYLTRPDLPRDAITALVGAKRKGKSTYALSLCAKLSHHHRVVIVQREDPEFVVRSRLEAMGANLDNIRIFSVQVMKRGQMVKLAFCADDLPHIIDVTERARADLLYIDPLQGLAQGDINKQSSADCLIDLTALAQHIHCAVLGVMHTNKGNGDVKFSVTGSDQWVAKCRSHLLLDSPDDDEDHAVVEQVSVSYEKAQNREVTFEVRQITGDDGKQYPVRIVSNVAPTERTVSDIIATRESEKAEPVDVDQLPDIALWIRGQLESCGNHMFATDLQKRGKDTMGYTSNQLRRSYRFANVGQTRQACSPPRSILFLKDKCTEHDAKRWGTPDSAIQGKGESMGSTSSMSNRNDPE